MSQRHEEREEQRQRVVDLVLVEVAVDEVEFPVQHPEQVAFRYSQHLLLQRLVVLQVFLPLIEIWFRLKEYDSVSDFT